MVCRADLAIAFPLIILWELIHRSCFCEMSLGVIGKGVMHRSAVNSTVRLEPRLRSWVPLCFITKVEKIGKFQYRLAPHCSKLWTAKHKKEPASQRSQGVNRRDSKRKREENQIH